MIGWKERMVIMLVVDSFNLSAESLSPLLGATRLVLKAADRDMDTVDEAAVNDMNMLLLMDG